MAVRRAGAWELYVNGDLWSSYAPSGDSTAPTITLLGGSNGTTPTGLLSNVSYYETALSAERIRAHYDAAIGFVPINRLPINVPMIRN